MDPFADPDPSDADYALAHYLDLEDDAGAALEERQVAADEYRRLRALEDVCEHPGPGDLPEPRPARDAFDDGFELDPSPAAGQAASSREGETAARGPEAEGADAASEPVAEEPPPAPRGSLFHLIPLRMGAKAPRDGNWLKKVYPRQEVLDWGKSGGNVGARLTHSALVIDYDPRNDLVGDSLERLAADVGLDVSTCPTTKTPSGGLHLYLRRPHELRIRGKLGEYPGIDLKSYGGQVVFPPSIHPDFPDGPRYQLDDSRPDYDQAPDAPAKLLELVARPQRSPDNGGDGNTPGDFSEEFCRVLLEPIDPTTWDYFHSREGWINLGMALHHATGGSHEGYVLWFEWSMRDPRPDTEEACEANWESFDLEHEGERRTGASLCFWAKEVLGHVPPRPAAEVFEEEPLEGVPAPAPPPPRTRRGMVVELLRYSTMKGVPVPTFLVAGLLLVGGITAIIGPPKRGKSLWSLAMALCIATGERFFGRDSQLGTVVYVCSEGGAARFRQRITAWLVHRAEGDEKKLAELERLVDENFALVVVPLKLPRDLKPLGDALRAAVGTGWDLAVFDTLARTLDGDEKDTSDMNHYVEAIDDLMHEGSFRTAAVVHHTGKVVSRGGRGANSFLGAVEREFLLDGPKGGPITARIKEDRYDGVFREVYSFKGIPIGEEGPQPAVLELQSPFLDYRHDALVEACVEAPEQTINASEALEVVWVAMKANPKTANCKEDSARRWIERHVPKDAPQAATNLQRLEDGSVRLVGEDYESNDEEAP